ncbi:hypothetical protein PanWU01x14_328320 [Parasponia andersonii]|uniref:Uncharacterized protein n=1 Tax=Parasponia andersonii TaxID=3476 RepID=A0A2P5AIU3_PARAD|nr:hypothetical protein PanWU01x14_328320 [Parasponia andersonii]
MMVRKIAKPSGAVRRALITSKNGPTQYTQSQINIQLIFSRVPLHTSFSHLLPSLNTQKLAQPSQSLFHFLFSSFTTTASQVFDLAIFLSCDVVISSISRHRGSNWSPSTSSDAGLKRGPAPSSDAAPSILGYIELQLSLNQCPASHSYRVPALTQSLSREELKLKLSSLNRTLSLSLSLSAARDPQPHSLSSSLSRRAQALRDLVS